MAQELLRTSCSGGQLTITDHGIIVEGKLIGRRQLSKNAYSGVDSAFYFFGRKKLTFRGQGGERIEVLDVKNRDAQQILDLLSSW